MTIHDISLRKLQGSKGPSSPKNTKDNLFSTDLVEVLLGISEGPIKGLKDGAKSYYIGQTTLKDPNGENNFDAFELIDYKGSEQGEDITSRTGGFGASTTVGTQLASNVPVIRTGTHTQIDYLDVRFAINQLVKSNKKGTFQHTGRWTIEYKPVSASTWTPVRTNEANPLPPQISGDNFDIFYGDKGSDANINGAPGDRPTYWTTSEPISTANAGIWFSRVPSFQPKIFDGETWKLPDNLSYANNHWNWTEASSWGTDKATKAFVGAKLPTTQVYEQGDYWLHTGELRVYFFNGSSWVIAGSTLRPGTFGENGTGGSVVVTDGEIALTGKATQVFPKEFRIPVDRIDEPYMIRVVKTSPNNTTSLFFDISWESFQEVTAKGYNFPGTATTQLVARASEQFSSIPDFGGIYQGRIIRVPSNYDPVARTYTGVWDGTWKLAYSNNPAFVGNDLVLNDRYGMNAYYPITLNKWDVYEAGVWCDTPVASGKPRFTFNGLISDPRGGRDALNYIFGIFAGRFFDDGNGTGVIKIDKDEGAAVIFTPENVLDGIFTYSFTEISTRHNEITVAFTNPDLQWQEDRRLVRDEDHIAQYGRIPHNFIAVGCTNPEEAVRRARYHMITGIKETMMVNFKTNRMGLYMSPYDVILVSDPDMDFGLSGRVQSVSGTRTINLREPIYLEPGFSHRISFQLISAATDDFVIETRDLTPASGALQQLVVTSDLPELPEDCVFTIEQTNGDSAPIAFRVMSISEVDGDPDNVEIQAMQMYRAKWLYIDGLVDTIDDLDKSVIDSKKKPNPPQNLRVRPTQRQIGARYATTITLDWDKSTTKTVTRYRIEGSRDNGPMSTLAETPLDQFEWDDVPPGEYVFQVSAIDINGYESKPEVIEHRLIGDTTVVPEVTGLRMVDEPTATTFESRSPTFNWARNTSPTHAEYVVAILSPDGSPIRNEVLADPTYTYEYTLNVGDNGGTPRRAFKISVASRDQYGFLSAYQELSVSNPAPAAPATQSLTLRKGVGVVKFDPPAERDFQGAVIHASTTPGFTPTAANRVYKGPNTDVPLDLEEGEVNYVRLAFYDVFGDAELNFGPEMAILVPAPDVGEGDNTPPAKPTDFTVTGGVGFIVGEWTNPPDADLEGVELFYNTTNDPQTAKFGAQSVGQSAVIPGLTPDQLYYVWARSKDRSGNRSDLTTVQTATPIRIGPDGLIDGIISAEKLAANAVEIGKIAANAVGSAQLTANAVTAVKIMANAITAPKIAAYSITARQLILADFSNLAVNGDFTQNGDGWVNGQGFTFGVETTPSSPVRNFAAKALANTTTAQLWSENFFPVEPGDEYYLEAYVQADVGAGATWRLQMQFQDATLTAVAYARVTDVVFTDGIAWTKMSGRVKVPATVNGNPTVRGRIQCEVRDITAVGPTCRIGRIWARRANAAQLVVDGGILANHIAANAITAAKIAANAITADKINVTNLAAISADLGNVNISNANIGTLTVGTANIDAGAVSAVTASFTSGASPSQTAEQTIATGAITVPAGTNILVNVGAYTTASGFTGSAGGLTGTMTVKRGGVAIGDTLFVVPVKEYGASQGMYFAGLINFAFVDTPPAGTHTYTVTVKSSRALSWSERSFVLMGLKR